MNNAKIQIANKAIKKVTILGIAVNIALGIVKVAAGLLVHSIALVADGIHSLSDLATDIAVLLGVHFSAKAPDKSHPYGHGRTETLSAFLISIALISIGGYMIYYAAMDLATARISSPAFSVIVISAISLFAKELLYRITKTVAVKYNSSVLYANAWHHRTDALSSLAVIAGVVAAYCGYSYGDQLAAVAVGIMIIIAAVSILAKCIREVSEAGVDDATIERIKNIINSNDRIANWHNLRTRTVGREVFVDLHILVDPKLNITDAHDIAEKLEDTMHEKISRPINITVHIEPDTDDLRK